MRPNDIFKEVHRESSQTLRKYGFSRSGQTNYLQREGNWGLINFQRSKDRRTDAVVFTINIGIASGRLLRFFPPPKFRVEATSKPDIWDCHCQERLGDLLPAHRDTWWRINSETDIEPLVSEIRGYLIELAIPEINMYISDEALRDLWLTGKSPGLTKLQRLEYLSVLLKSLGPEALLKPTLDQLRETTDDAEVFIERLMREGI